MPHVPILCRLLPAELRTPVAEWPQTFQSPFFQHCKSLSQLISPLSGLHFPPVVATLTACPIIQQNHVVCSRYYVMPPSGIAGWLLIFTPPFMLPLLPPFCSVTISIELSKHRCSYSLFHSMTLSMLLEYTCAWDFVGKHFLSTLPHFVQGFSGGFLLTLLPLFLSPHVCHQPGKALQAGESS